MWCHKGDLTKEEPALFLLPHSPLVHSLSVPCPLMGIESIAFQTSSTHELAPFTPSLSFFRLCLPLFLKNRTISAFIFSHYLFKSSSNLNKLKSCKSSWYTQVCELSCWCIPYSEFLIADDPMIWQLWGTWLLITHFKDNGFILQLLLLSWWTSLPWSSLRYIFSLNSHLCNSWILGVQTGREGRLCICALLLNLLNTVAVLLGKSLF